MYHLLDHYERLIFRLALIHAPPLFQVELKKRRLGLGGYALVLGCPEPWTIQP